ncbi:MAG: BlaI/MecI/CopY family transcriptional regulator [Acidobacteriota bacterium]
MSSQNENKSNPKQAPTGPAVKISDAEWEVMSLLWEESPQTSYRIVDRLQASTEWSPKTVKTLLSRLVKKGALTFEKEANRYLYSPKVSRREAIRQESRSFMDRIFQGDAASMLLYFVEETPLSDKDRDDLRGLLDRMDESEGGP